MDSPFKIVLFDDTNFIIFYSDLHELQVMEK